MGLSRRSREAELAGMVGRGRRERSRSRTGACGAGGKVRRGEGRQHGGVKCQKRPSTSSKIGERERENRIRQ